MYAKYDDKKWEVVVTWDLPAGARVDKNDWLAVYREGENDNTAHVKYDFASGETSGTRPIRIKRRVQTNDICLVRYVNGSNHKTYATSNRFVVAPEDSELSQQVSQEEQAAGLARGRIHDQIQYVEDDVGLDGMVAEIRSGISTSQSLANLRRNRKSVAEEKDPDPESPEAGSSSPSGVPQAAQSDATNPPSGGPPGAQPPSGVAATPQRATSPPTGSPVAAAAAPPAGPVTPAANQRWLWKRGHFRKNWKRRYFDVQNGNLRYAADAPKGSKPHKIKKSLPLATISKIQRCPDKDKKQYVFSFQSKKTPYFISCESDQVRQLWINYLKSLTKQK